jgi:pimeloyl-ACP methyl ester carboxylesterase
MINKLYNEEYLSEETFVKIKSPTLVMTGEKDLYHSVDKVKKAGEFIKGSQVVVIKDCGHVVFDCNFDRVWEEITAFLKK